MPDVEPYGVMPYSEINDLKKQVKKLQDKDTTDPDQLLKAVTGLTKNMDSMLQLFKTAADEMKIEEEEEKEIGKQLQPIMDKLDEIIEQNKIIAEGMVAVSDLVKERLPEKKAEEDIPKRDEGDGQFFPNLNPVNIPQPPPVRPSSSPGQQMYGRRPAPIQRTSSTTMMPPPPTFGPRPPMPEPSGDDMMGMPPPPPMDNNSKKGGFFGRK